MRILVCVKRVPLTGGRMVLSADEQSLETRHLGFTISPHEECGVEQAVQLVEQHGGEVTVLALGPPEAEEQIRDTLAIGADRGLLLATGGEEWDPQATAAAILAAIRAEDDFDLIVFGNESADSGNYQVGIRVAHALGRPVVTGLKGLSVEDGVARCEQEVAGRARRLPRAAAGRGVRARGHQPAPLPVGAGQAAREEEAGGHEHAGAVRERASRSCGWWCRPARASRRRSSARARRPRLPW